MRRRSLWRVLAYATLAGAAKQMSRAVLELVFGRRKSFPFDLIVERLWTRIVSGGGKIALMVTLTLLRLACLAAVRIAAIGEERADRYVRGFHVACGIAPAVAFGAASLTSMRFIVDMLVLAAIVVGTFATYFVMGNRCVACGRHRLNAALLKTASGCGHEHLWLLRHWTEEPYSQHLPIRQELPEAR